MTNNERFNRALNATSDPRRMLNALRALAPIISAAKTQQERDALLNSMQEEGAAE